jgi:hypothetical protein
MNSSYGPALRRFWWVLVIGAIVAAAFATLLSYSVSGFPPKFTPREASDYTSEARLFVTSGDAPYLRTSVTVKSTVPIGTTGQEATTEEVQQPDVKTLVDAANVYPLLIESDDVAQLRTEMFGSLEGEVSAQTIYAAATAARYLPSDIPVLEVFATAGTPKAARTLAGATTEAFQKWIVREQQRAQIPESQRIQVKDLEAPADPIAVGGQSMGLPLLAFLAIFTVFAAGANILHRLYPPKGSVSADGRDEAEAEDDRTRLERQERHVGISETG